MALVLAYLGGGTFGVLSALRASAASGNDAARSGDAVRVRAVAAVADTGGRRGEVDHGRLPSLRRFYRGDHDDDDT